MGLPWGLVSRPKLVGRLQGLAAQIDACESAVIHDWQ